MEATSLQPATMVSPLNFRRRTRERPLFPSASSRLSRLLKALQITFGLCGAERRRKRLPTLPVDLI